jgi:hypothetical protein
MEIVMNKSLAVFLVLLPLAGTLSAQNDPITGIAVSTDPARAAEVERHAQEIMARQQASASGTSGASGTGASSEMMQEKPHKGRMHGQRHKRMHEAPKGSSSSTDGGGAGQR